MMGQSRFESARNKIRQSIRVVRNRRSWAAMIKTVRLKRRCRRQQQKDDPPMDDPTDETALNSATRARVSLLPFSLWQNHHFQIMLLVMADCVSNDSLFLEPPMPLNAHTCQHCHPFAVGPSNNPGGEAEADHPFPRYFAILNSAQLSASYSRVL